MDQLGIGHHRWAIPEGHIPSVSHGSARNSIGPAALCVLVAGEQEAHLEVAIFFIRCGPAGTCPMTVSARRTLRWPDRGGRAEVVQHTRFD